MKDTIQAFDSVADTYNAIQKKNLGSFGEDLSLFASYKIRIAQNTVKKAPEAVLEFGCGIGRNMPFLHEAFPDSKLYGCDVSKKSLELAEQHFENAVYSHIQSPEDLGKYYGNHIDYIFVSCVFHHIPERDQDTWLRNLYSILSPGGHIIIFEHNPCNPLTRHFFNTCPYDADAVMLRRGHLKKLLAASGFQCLSCPYTLFFIWRSAFFERLERLLWWLPLGGQYYALASKP